MEEIAVTDIEGISVGHAQNLKAATGCTVVIGREGVTAGGGCSGRGARDKRNRSPGPGQPGPENFTRWS